MLYDADGRREATVAETPYTLALVAAGVIGVAGSGSPPASRPLADPVYVPRGTRQPFRNRGGGTLEELDLALNDSFPTNWETIAENVVTYANSGLKNDGTSGAAWPVFWPWLAALHRMVAPENLLARIGLYYSTDHATAAGGIGVALGDSYTDLSPYGSNPIFVDPTVGRKQTETPAIVPFPTTGLPAMAYSAQAADSTQVTGLAGDSLDGVTGWTKKNGIILPPTASNDVKQGPQNNTYFRPFLRDGQGFGWHIGGGGANVMHYLSHTTDPDISKSWQVDMIPMPPLVGHGIPGLIDWQWHWNGCSAVLWRGKRYGVGVLSPPDGTTGLERVPVVGELRADLRNFVAGLRRISIDGVQAGTLAHVIEDGGRLYGVTTTATDPADNHTRTFNIVEAVL